MRKAIVGSAALHVGIIASTMIVWPHALDLPDEPTPVIPVELVSISEETNIRATAADETPPQPEDQPPPQPQADAAPPETEVAPDEKPAAIKPIEKAEDAPKPPTVAPRQKPKPEAKRNKFDVDSILALLDQKTQNPSTPQPNAAKAETTQKGFGAQSAMTMSEVDALLAQMRECWNPPAGAPNPEKLIVQVRVFLTQDGHLERPAQLLTKSSDPYMRSAGEAALRAVNVCEPYKMPVDKYSSWHEIELTFDPSKMVGR